MISCKEPKCKKARSRIRKLTSGLKWILEIKIPTLEKENIETWDERNKACHDYNVIYRILQLSKFTNLPKFENYEMPNGDPVSDYTVDIEGKVMESGRVRMDVNLIKIPEEVVEWHTKYRKNSYSLRDIQNKKTKKKRKIYGKKSRK